jgi:hypothetical protein
MSYAMYDLHILTRNKILHYKMNYEKTVKFNFLLK